MTINIIECLSLQIREYTYPEMSAPPNREAESFLATRISLVLSLNTPRSQICRGSQKAEGLEKSQIEIAGDVGN